MWKMWTPRPMHPWHLTKPPKNDLVPNRRTAACAILRAQALVISQRDSDLLARSCGLRVVSGCFFQEYCCAQSSPCWVGFPLEYLYYMVFSGKRQS
jgi:hypothetical protein